MADALGMTSERRTWLVSIVGCAIALALPSAASAKDYCVDTACPGTNVDSIEQALDFSDDDSILDRIFLGPSVYTAKNPWGFDYNGGPIEIIGAGRGKTILTAAASSTSILSLATTKETSSIHDLTIRVPAWADQGMVGLRTINDVRRVDVTQDPKQLKDHTGVQIWNGAALEDSRVDMGSDGTAVVFYSGGGAVRDSTLRGRVGVKSVYGDLAIERSTITAYDAGLQAERKLTTISDSLVHLASYSNGTGIRADTQAGSGSDVTVKADGVTVVVPPFQIYNGVSASTFNAPGLNAEVDLTNSVIRGGGTPLSAYAAGMGGATVKAAYSDYDPTGNKKLGVSAGIYESDVSNVGDAGFVDAANGDFHLLPTSELLDMGDPATAQGLDLDGKPLVADGDADGGARRDLGAYELQPPAPAGGEPGGGEPAGGQPAPDTVAPVITGFRRRGTRLRYSLSEPARVALRIKRARNGRYRTIATLTRRGAAGANTIRFTGRVGRRALRPGRYRAVLTATDAAGNRSAPRAIRLRIARVR